MAYIYIDDLEQTEKAGKPTVQLSGTDGNVFSLMGTCKKAMKRYQQQIDPTYNTDLMFREMQDEINQGDYNNALSVMLAYCEVY